ncbi:hypothetical protein Tco_0798185 [Tanacetum coccineum]
MGQEWVSMYTGSLAKVTASLITRQVRSQQEERESKQESSSKLSQVSKQEVAIKKQIDKQESISRSKRTSSKSKKVTSSKSKKVTSSKKEKKAAESKRNLARMVETSGTLTVREQDPVTRERRRKKEYSTKLISFQTLPEDIHLQDAKHKDAKDVWESIRVRYLGADRVQKARLQTLRSELEMLKMKENETINEFSGKIGSIMAKFKSLDSRLDEEVAVQKASQFSPKEISTNHCLYRAIFGD